LEVKPILYLAYRPQSMHFNHNRNVSTIATPLMLGHLGQPPNQSPQTWPKRFLIPSNSPTCAQEIIHQFQLRHIHSPSKHLSSGPDRGAQHLHPLPRCHKRNRSLLIFSSHIPDFYHNLNHINIHILDAAYPPTTAFNLATGQVQDFGNFAVITSPPVCSSQGGDRHA
jgi:hypothetical protein